jgi:DMSO/TMAO reductase YedYZ molybdopterin-dependent catalytic subunit
MSTADASDAGSDAPLPLSDPISDRDYGVDEPGLGYGVALGLVATGSGLAAAEVVVGLAEGSASPVVPVGQVFIDWVPKPLKDWAIEQFGTNDKVVLVSGALIVVVLLGVTVGIMALRGQRAGAYALTSAIGVLGGVAVMTRPAPSFGKLLPTIVGTVVSIAVLRWLSPRRNESDAIGGPRFEPMDRRRFVLGAIGVGSIAVLAGGLGRLLQNRFDVSGERAALALPAPDGPPPVLPGDVDLGIEGITPFVIPNGDFYRIDTALVVPQVSKDSWRLTIDGLVDRPMELTFDDLLARPQVERYITLSCVSNQVGGTLVGNALWQGVLLKDILEEAGLQQGAEQLASKSVDGWTCGTPVEVIMDGRDALLAVAMNGEPLPAQHGYPVRMVVPGLFGYVSATKWVTDMRLTRWEDFEGYWIPRGWSKLGPVKTMARIDTPRYGNSRPRGDVAIGGVAWAVHRGISAVQVRVEMADSDAGPGPWMDAELGGVPSNDTWVQWVFRFDGEPGKYYIEARAVDGKGEPQPEEPRAVAPDGAQGYHRIALDVTG